MTVRRPARWTGERASATVEFALVLPLVLVVALAVLQLALVAKDALIVQEAARAGAREGAVSASDDAVRSAVVDAAASLDPGAITIAVRRDGGAGTPVRVDVRYRVAVVVPLVSWLFPDQIDLGATSVMRQETG